MSNNKINKNTSANNSSIFQFGINAFTIVAADDVGGQLKNNKTMKQNLNVKITIGLVLIMSFTNCSQNQGVENQKDNSILTQQNVQTTNIKNDHQTNNEDKLSEDVDLIEIEELLINGKVSWKTTIEEIQKEFKIDSIISLPKEMELSDADKLIYIGSTYFEYYEEKNYCEIGIIVFDEKVNKIELNGNVIDYNTTPEKLAQNYPNCNQIGDIEIYNDENQYKFCHVDIKNNDMQLLFFFNQGKLKRIDNWFPS